MNFVRLSACVVEYAWVYSCDMITSVTSSGKYRAVAPCNLGLMLWFVVEMITPLASSCTTKAIGRALSVAFTFGLIFCFGMEMRELIGAGAQAMFVLIPLSLILYAVVRVIWAARLDVSQHQMKKNGFFIKKIVSDYVVVVRLPGLSSKFATRFLAVPTPPPRFCLALHFISRGLFRNIHIW